jgi:hypothetical protein
MQVGDRAATKTGFRQFQAISGNGYRWVTQQQLSRFTIQALDAGE